MTIIRLSLFQARELVRNQFFLLTLITSTTSAYILQSSTFENLSASTLREISMRSGMFGAWSLSLTATGLIGYQRFQGTLIHLFNSRNKPFVVVGTLLISAALMGSLAYPATILASIFIDSKSLGLLTFGDLGLWSCFVVATAVTSALLATLFLASSNAIIYEGILTFPIVFLSGIFAINANHLSILKYAPYLLPTFYPVNAMLEPSVFDGDLVPWYVGFVLVSIVWTLVLLLLLENVLVRGARTGSLDID